MTRVATLLLTLGLLLGAQPRVALAADLPAPGPSGFIEDLPVPSANPAADAPARGALPVATADAIVVDAREAFRRRDRARLAAARNAAAAAQHPLAMWVDYWELSNRLSEATQDELEDFYARWQGTYVEDRLRNDWLLELGKRRDWRNFGREFPRFRMNDDREVTCYALLLRHQAGEDVRTAARAAWMAQREFDDGCSLMATSLFAAQRFGPDEVWQKARQAAEASRPRVARHAAGLISESTANAVNEIFDSPVRFLAKRSAPATRTAQELVALALVRLAATDVAAAAAQLEEPWRTQLPPDTVAWLWSNIGRQAAQKMLPEADSYFQRGAAMLGKQGGGDLEVPDDTLAWQVRAALRAAPNGPRWASILKAVQGMSAAEQREPAWVYWKARALIGTAARGADGDAQRAYARELLGGLAGQFNFYGKLASEELVGAQPLPPRPAALTADERAAAANHPGLTRALQLIGLGLRGEGVREWNFSLRGMDDRQLLAAAQRACDREIWDRCINTSDRTQVEIDLQQRFPTPFRREVVAAAEEAGLDAAYVYGLIRQESRFVLDARSGVGASGLMQLMPSTARIVARKLGMVYSSDMITDRMVNLKLGTGYLKMVLDDFGGSQALAAAAYNAGPNRPRRWREGPTMEVAAWAESIPFSETRDYVKKVLSNAAYYSAVLGQKTVASLKPRVTGRIGPRPPDAPAENTDLP